jgi:predicted ATPase/DNA-binding winged helix-turn-helix (wHTH) protein
LRRFSVEFSLKERKECYVPSPPLILFPPFRLDVLNEQLWRDNELLTVRPKPFAVLAYLATHPGRLVTAAELRKAVWPQTYVGEGLLRGYIRDVRIVLDDDPEAPRFIQTVPRRGYRFLAEVVSGQYAVVSRPEQSSVQPQAPSVQRQESAIRIPQTTIPLVGREAELGQLHNRLGKALQGTRQVVFVTGEPGIGKTTVVDTFLAQVAVKGDLWTARGQCVEHYGAGEAYLPVLEALGQLCRRPGGEQVIVLLSRYAPTWLVQMPGLMSDTELEAVQRRVQGATRERMLRELAEAIEVQTAAMPLVLVLEDLQWSDYSTLDLLSSLAQRRGPARLLLLGTYRSADVIVSGHPLRALKQGLYMHGQCEELPLGFLTAAEVTQYLAARFPQQQFPPELGRIIHQRTEGNPLFMVNVVDYWVSQGVLVEADGQWKLAARVEDITVGVPESLRRMIEKQLERLTPEERRMVEAASVVGGEFSTATVAAGLEEQRERVEEWCERLAKRGQFLRARGIETLAEGTVTGRYSFLHGLYQQVLYERLAAVRCVRLHRRIGEGAKRAYGSRVGEHAAELAMHFERGQDYQQAVQYLTQAADNAMRRHAYQEEITLLTMTLEILKFLPDTPERAQQELALQISLGAPLLMTRGYAAPEVEQTYARAQALCQQIGESPQLLPAIAGLFRFYLMRAELQTARELGEQVLRLAQEMGDNLVFLIAHSLLGVPLLALGNPLASREHLEQGIALYNPEQHRFIAVLFGDDPGVSCLSFVALALWFLGYPEQALKRNLESLVLAQELALPYSMAFALSFTAWVHVRRREGGEAQVRTRALLSLAAEQGFQLWTAEGTILQGWTLVEQGQIEEGLAQMQQGLAAYRTIGAEMGRPSHLALLAEAYGKAGRTDEGFSVLTEALATVGKTGEHSYEAELYRLKGELLLQSGVQGLGSRKIKNQKAKGKRQK